MSESTTQTERDFWSGFSPPIDVQALRDEIDGLRLRWEAYAVWAEEGHRRYDVALPLVRAARSLIEGQGNLDFLERVARALRDGDFRSLKDRRKKPSKYPPPDWIGRALGIRGTKPSDALAAIERTVAELESAQAAFARYFEALGPLASRNLGRLAAARVLHEVLREYQRPNTRGYSGAEAMYYLGFEDHRPERDDRQDNAVGRFWGRVAMAKKICRIDPCLAYPRVV